MDGIALGIDIGTVRTGVARSDGLGLMAHPLCTVRAKSRGELVDRLCELVADNEATTIVVGLPKNQYGKDSDQAAGVRAVVEDLRSKVPGAEIVFIDERFTTQEAERSLLAADLRRDKRKQVRDQLAACLILQTWLDQRR